MSGNGMECALLTSVMDCRPSEIIGVSSGRSDAMNAQLPDQRSVILKGPASRLDRMSGREEIKMIDEQKIREKAYELWQQAGSPEGESESLEFWDKAQKTLEADQPPADAALLDSSEQIESSGERPAD
ncbi:DUF2934 domain-containing protein [Pseudomonas syringae]